MISPEQLRAARALLDWTTLDLARRTGLTVNGINKIERSRVTAQKDTLGKVQNVFEKEGVEFLPSSGVRWRSKMVIIMEGVDSNRRLAIDVTKHLQKTGGEFLILHADEDSASVNLGDDFMNHQFKLRKKAGITHRLLTSENSPGRYQALDGCYREMPHTYFSRYPLFIYGSRLALLSPDIDPKVIIVEAARVAESARRLFNFVWDHTQKQSLKKKDVKKGRKKKAGKT